MQFHVDVPALAGLDAVFAILCAACLVPAHWNCSWCRFLLWVLVRVLVYEQHLLLRLLLLPSALPSAAVSVEGLLMQSHVEAPALPVVERGADGKLILTASPLFPGGFTTIKENMGTFFRTLSLRIAMPFRQGCDLLNPTSCSVNTVVYMDVWMDLLVFSKHFKAFLIHHTSPIKFMYIHWVFPLENGGSDRYLCIYKYIYIPLVPHKAVAEVSKIGNL